MITNGTNRSAVTVPGVGHVPAAGAADRMVVESGRRRARLLDRGAGRPHLLRRVPVRRVGAFDVECRERRHVARRIALHGRPARRERRADAGRPLYGIPERLQRGQHHAQLHRRVARHDDLARRHGVHRAPALRSGEPRCVGAREPARERLVVESRRRAAAASSSSGRARGSISSATCTTTAAIPYGTSACTSSPIHVRSRAHGGAYANGQSMFGPYKPATQTSNTFAPVTITFSASRHGDHDAAQQPDDRAHAAAVLER